MEEKKGNNLEDTEGVNKFFVTLLKNIIFSVISVVNF